jgi:hypothetical protein
MQCSYLFGNEERREAAEEEANGEKESEKPGIPESRPTVLFELPGGFLSRSFLCSTASSTFLLYRSGYRVCVGTKTS